MPQAPPRLASADDRLFYQRTGDALRRRRIELDLTLETVANAVGVSRPMIHKYEMGWKLSCDTLIRLASALDTLPSELLNVPDPYEQPELRRLLTAWSRLPNETSRSAVINLLESLAQPTASAGTEEDRQG